MLWIRVWNLWKIWSPVRTLLAMSASSWMFGSLRKPRRRNSIGEEKSKNSFTFSYTIWYFLSSCVFPLCLKFLYQKIELNCFSDNSKPQQQNQDRKNIAAVVGESYSSISVQVFEPRNFQSNRTCFSWQTYYNFFVFLKSVQRARARTYQIKVNSRSLQGKLEILFLI